MRTSGEREIRTRAVRGHGRRRAVFLCASAAIGAASFLESPVRAAVYSWTGATSGNWATGTNWTDPGPDPPPPEGSDLIFLNLGNTSTTQNIANNYHFLSLTFASNAQAYTIAGTNDFDLDPANSTITQSSGSTQSISADFVHSGAINAVRTLTLTGDGAGVVTLSGVISDSNGNRKITITKSGTSTFVLSNTNTHDNGATINGGVLRIINANALGGGSVTINNGVLEIGAVSLTANDLTLNNGATLRGTGAASYTKSGFPVIASGASVTLATTAVADTLTIGSGYTNAGGSTVTPTVNIANPGGGRIILNSGNSAFRGKWVIQSGTLQSATNGNNTFGIGNTSGSLTGSTVTLAGGDLEVRGTANTTYNSGTAGAEVPMSFTANGTALAGRSAAGAGVTHTFGGLTLGNNSNINATFTHTGNVTSGTSQFTFGAVTLNGDATVTVNKPNGAVTSIVSFGAVGQTGGTRSLTKAGPGQLTLTAANTYAGNTTISGGSLVLNSGATLASPIISVGSGATWNVSAFASGYNLTSTQTVNGTGTVSGRLNIGGGATIAPGTSTGIITTGNEEWLGGGVYQWEVTDATGAAGTGFDQIQMQSLTISATTGSKFTIKIIGSNPANFNPNPGPPGFYSWIIATTTGVTGFAANKFNLDTSSFTPIASGGHFIIQQSGNNIQLFYVPEPSSITMLGAAAGMLLARRRRRCA